MIERYFLPATEWGTEAKSEESMWFGGLGRNVDFPEAATGFQWHCPVSQGPFPDCKGIDIISQNAWPGWAQESSLGAP